MRRALFLGLILAGCGEPGAATPVGDGGNADAGALGDPDGGGADAGLTSDLDGGAADGGGADAGTASDAGALDGGAGDAGATDAGPNDGGALPLDGGAFGCPPTLPTQAFRDDFDGQALDLTRWDVVQQNVGGGVFTQLTKMLASNVTVSGGQLHLAVHRHCSDPYPSGAAINAGQCAGGNFYSGAWLKGKPGVGAGRGLMRFWARVPPATQGTFPGLWARNTEASPNYGELDLIEQWWDGNTKGSASDPHTFSSTTWLASGTAHTTNNLVGPVADVNGGFHVYEVEWDGTGATARITYAWRDTPSSAQVVLKQVDATSGGLSGVVSDAALKTILSFGFRPYVDFAVQPDTVWHVGPDAAPTFAPGTLDVEAVVTCLP